MGRLIPLWAWFIGLFARKLPPPKAPQLRTYFVVCERNTCGHRHKVMARSIDEVPHDELAQAFAKRHDGHPLTIVNEGETEFEPFHTSMLTAKRTA